MTVSEVAHRLVSLCRKGEWEKAQNELYHKEIESTEPKEMGGEVSIGLNAIHEKNLKWAGMSEKVHHWEVSDPLIADGYFCCSMYNDVTMKGGTRIKSTELCVYKVKEGKIVSEKFFHGPMDLE
jgi:hypothetical protein